MRGPTLSHADVDTYLGAVDWLRGILSRAEVADSWARLGDIGSLRAFTKAEKALPDALRVL
jgi:hypothetical protein